MQIEPECLERMLRAYQRYDMPVVSTVSLLLALEKILGSHRVFITRSSVDLLDVIREIMPDAALQDVRIAAYLIGEDFEASSIRLICDGIANGRDPDGCESLTEDQKVALKKLLETKP